MRKFIINISAVIAITVFAVITFLLIKHNAEWKKCTDKYCLYKQVYLKNTANVSDCQYFTHNIKPGFSKKYSDASSLRNNCIYYAAFRDADKSTRRTCGTQPDYNINYSGSMLPMLILSNAIEKDKLNQLSKPYNENGISITQTDAFNSSTIGILIFGPDAVSNYYTQTVFFCNKDHALIPFYYYASLDGITAKRNKHKLQVQKYIDKQPIGHADILSQMPITLDDGIEYFYIDSKDLLSLNDLTNNGYKDLIMLKSAKVDGKIIGFPAVCLYQHNKKSCKYIESKQPYKPYFYSYYIHAKNNNILIDSQDGHRHLTYKLQNGKLILTAQLTIPHNWAAISNKAN